MNDKNSCIDLNINNLNKEENILETNSRLFYDLMPFKVREILLVSSIYDAFIVEEEGLISELVIWEYRHLLLSSPPRVTHVKSGKEAIEKAKSAHPGIGRMVYVGDAIWDVQTTRNMNLNFIGVRINGDVNVLERAGASIVIKDYLDYSSFQQAVHIARPPA